MALNVILAILIPVGTAVGAVLGYYLSMRGKREEWAKEYREKRLAPLIDFVNRYMGTASQYHFHYAWKESLEKQKEPVADQTQRAREMSEANDRLMQSHARLMELHEGEAWLGFFMPATLDEQLDALRERWLYAQRVYRNEPTSENLQEIMAIARKLLDRADEVIIKGGKAPTTGT